MDPSVWIFQTLRDVWDFVWAYGEVLLILGIGLGVLYFLVNYEEPEQKIEINE